MEFLECCTRFRVPQDNTMDASFHVEDLWAQRLVEVRCATEINAQGLSIRYEQDAVEPSQPIENYIGTTQR